MPVKIWEKRKRRNGISTFLSFPDKLFFTFSLSFCSISEYDMFVNNFVPLFRAMKYVGHTLTLLPLLTRMYKTLQGIYFFSGSSSTFSMYPHFRIISLFTCDKNEWKIRINLQSQWPCVLNTTLVQQPRWWAGKNLLAMCIFLFGF